MVAAVTGANGFIGKHLVKALQAKGIEVFKIDHKLLQHPERLRAVIMNIRPDYIFHLSAYGNMATQKNEQDIFEANVMGTFNLLEASKAVNYKAFINFGTSSEYGKKDKPMTEEDIPEAYSFYATTKIASTYLCRAFAKEYTKPIVTVRPFSVYGEFEADFRFIPSIISHLHSGLTMEFNVEGVHDWIYIEDFIQGLFFIINNSQDLYGEVVNIGTGKQTENQEIISYLEKISGRKLLTNYIPNNRQYDSKVWMNGSTKLRSLGWSPKVSLEEGLRKVYSFYTYA